ncbi:hypothetical protein FJY94_08095 [Candidatus Kaiserbacteria bacterium]|nr:hypothetical protein [Candidatus Kaiserbacteria bacterium]
MANEPQDTAPAEANWRSPYLGVGVLLSVVGIYILLTSDSTLGFRLGYVTGALAASAVLSLLPFLVWRYATHIGRRQPLGAAFNIFIALTIVVWILLFLVAKFSLESRIGAQTSAEQEFTGDEKGWTQEDTGSSEVGPWLRYDPPGTRYCRYHNGNIQRMFPPGVKPNAPAANPFCLIGSKTVPPQ